MPRRRSPATVGTNAGGNFGFQLDHAIYLKRVQPGVLPKRILFCGVGRDGVTKRPDAR